MVVNMIHLGGCQNKFLQPLLMEVLDLLRMSYWRSSVSHVFRDGNRCADYLANKGHSSSFVWTVFDRAISSLALILQEDALSRSFPRFVCVCVGCGG